MSKVDQAENEAERAGRDFEEAVERLKDAIVRAARPEAEDYLRRRVEALGVEANAAIERVSKDAETALRGTVRNLRQAAQAELDILSEDPFKVWGIVFAAGFLAGLWIFRRNNQMDRENAA
jgi:ElaB/YqjD/DUF883 family membrane-anchored ribosome-binding protein